MPQFDKSFILKNIFSASSLSIYNSKEILIKTVRLEVRIMCPDKMTCILVCCYLFSEHANSAHFKTIYNPDIHVMFVTEKLKTNFSIYQHNSVHSEVWDAVKGPQKLL